MGDRGVGEDTTKDASAGINKDASSNEAAAKKGSVSAMVDTVSKERGYKCSRSARASRDLSAISIVLTSQIKSKDAALGDFAVTLLLTAPNGLRTGVNAVSGESFEEIPRCSYFDNIIKVPNEEGAGAAWRKIEDFIPVAGQNLLTVFGTGEGTYSLSVLIYDIHGESSISELENIPVDTGVRHSYTIDIGYAPRPFAWMRGSYEGDVESTPLADRLLSYATVSKKRTSLARKTTRVSLLILYANAVDPKSFGASLNGSDTSELFSPLPGGSEMVELPIHKGENVLAISIEGTLPDGKIVKDADKLIFVVGK